MAPYNAPHVPVDRERGYGGHHCSIRSEVRANKSHFPKVLRVKTPTSGGRAAEVT